MVGVAALAAPAASPGATTIGQTTAGTNNCGEDVLTVVQDATAPTSPSYAVPAGGGVITSWQHDAASNTATLNPTGVDMRLKLFRRTGVPGAYLTVGESAVQTLTTGGLKTFPTRIPVQAGDLLGYRSELGYDRCDNGNAVTGDVTYYHDAGSDPPVGSTVDLLIAPLTRINVAATVEPDADGDGFGDETQDGCPSEGDTQGGCVAPETTITRGPKDKTKKKKATFEFTSTEPGSSFECSLDGKTTFKPCTSPFTFKVKKGKHTFQVQATDPGGTVDGSPASDKWKVKKKKK